MVGLPDLRMARFSAVVRSFACTTCIGCAKELAGLSSSLGIGCAWVSFVVIALAPIDENLNKRGVGFKVITGAHRQVAPGILVAKMIWILFAVSSSYLQDFSKETDP